MTFDDACAPSSGPVVMRIIRINMETAKTTPMITPLSLELRIASGAVISVVPDVMLTSTAALQVQ